MMFDWLTYQSNLLVTPHWREELSSKFYFLIPKNTNFKIWKESAEVELRRMRSSSVALVLPELLSFMRYGKRATESPSLDTFLV